MAKGFKSKVTLFNAINRNGILFVEGRKRLLHNAKSPRDTWNPYFRNYELNGFTLSYACILDKLLTFVIYLFLSHQERYPIGQTFHSQMDLNLLFAQSVCVCVCICVSSCVLLPIYATRRSINNKNALSEWKIVFPIRIARMICVVYETTACSALN